MPSHTASERSKKRKKKRGRSNPMARAVLSGTGQAKVAKVLHEFKRGSLRSSGGAKVTKRKQAVAIALSEGRRAEGRRG